MTVTLVPARALHIKPIAERMREIDRREAAAFGHGPRTALALGYHGSTLALTALVDGRPEGMLGVTPASVIESRGTVWMLGSDAILAHARELVAMAGQVLAMLHWHYRVLENHVSADNAPAIRLLRRWGFHVEREGAEFGGMMFLPFRREI